MLLEGDGILDDLTDPTLVIQYEGGGDTTSLLLQSGLFYVTGGVAFSLPATLDLAQVKNAGLAAQDGTVTVVSPLAIVD